MCVLVERESDCDISASPEPNIAREGSESRVRINDLVKNKKSWKKSKSKNNYWRENK